MEEEQANLFFKNSNISNEKQFFNFIKVLDYENIKDFISEKKIFLKNLKDTENGLTPLHYAAILGDLELTKILISNGSKIKEIDKNGFNVFHYAADNDQFNIIEYLSKFDKTKEIFKKSFDTKILLSNSIPIYISGGRTPIHWASEKGNLDSIKKLIELNLYPFEKDDDGNTSIDLSNIHNRKEVIEFYIQKFELKNFKILNEIERKEKKEEIYKKCKNRMKLISKLIETVEYIPKNVEIFKFSNVSQVLIYFRISKGFI